MIHRRWLLAALLFLPVPGLAQSSSFTHLLDGTIAYRAPLPWSVARRVVAPGAEGAILEYQEERDTALTMAVVAYRVLPRTDFARWTDSVLARAQPSPVAERLADTALAVESRSILWRDPAELTMDRFVRTEAGILWIRMIMPSAPPHPSVIKARLHAVDDLMTTIRADSELLFPNGSRLGLVVF